MSRKNRKSIKIEYKGATYCGVRKNGKVSVRIERTARGQHLIAGVFDPVARTWHNENGDTPLPNHIKSEIERIFN